MNKVEILVIDDEPQIQKLLRITLEASDYKVREAQSAKEGMTQIVSHPPDLILLDLGLPDMSGHEILKKIREWYHRPVIMLTAQSGEEDIVRALDNGANDYLVKPFRTGELLARIRSALRASSKNEHDELFVMGELQLDPVSRLVKKGKEVVKLTSTEYNLLFLFFKHEGRVLTHQYLLREIWGPGYIGQSQYLRVFIAQLRKKLEKEPNRPEYIHTESGVGYRFSLTES